MGPLLFLICINDLPQAVQNSTVSMYADGTSLCYQSSDINVLNEVINNDLKQLDTWLQGNKLSLNVAKTNAMLVSTKQKHNILKSRNEDLDFKIRDNELEIIQKTKYLGVQVDKSLNWKEHIKTVSTKVSRAIRYWLFKACQDFPTAGNIEDSSHRYCRATLIDIIALFGVVPVRLSLTLLIPGFLDPCSTRGGHKVPPSVKSPILQI